MNRHAPIGAESPQAVAFLLVDQFSMIAFASCLEPLRLANHASGRQLFAWTLVSLDGQPVQASNGIPVPVDGALRDLGAVPMVVVCAGMDVHKRDAAAIAPHLRRLASFGTAIGALCTGTYILARAGLLDGHRCTIHWENHEGLREEFPNLTVTQELYEVDRGRFTCAGGTAAIDMMLAFVAEREGPTLAAAVADELIHHRIRDKGERQRMALRARLGVANAKVLAVVALMEAHVEDPLSCGQLAEAAGLSPRQLERLFRNHLGVTPTAHYLGIRLDRARHLLMQTSMPVLAVGLACGFVSASHFAACYSARFARTPTEDRRGKAPAAARQAAAAPQT